jgi:hypothetical protein
LNTSFHAVGDKTTHSGQYVIKKKKRRVNLETWRLSHQSVLELRYFATGVREFYVKLRDYAIFLDKKHRLFFLQHERQPFVTLKR